MMKPGRSPHPQLRHRTLAPLTSVYDRPHGTGKSDHCGQLQQVTGRSCRTWRVILFQDYLQQQQQQEQK
jgi:hypothetical protein